MDYYDAADEIHDKLLETGEGSEDLKQRFCALVTLWVDRLKEDARTPFQQILETGEGTYFERCRAAMYG